MPIPVLLLLAAWLGAGTVQGGPWCAGQEAGMGSYDPQRSEIALCAERIRMHHDRMDDVEPGKVLVVEWRKQLEHWQAERHATKG